MSVTYVSVRLHIIKSCSTGKRLYFVQWHELQGRSPIWGTVAIADGDTVFGGEEVLGWVEDPLTVKAEDSARISPGTVDGLLPCREGDGLAARMGHVPLR